MGSMASPSHPFVLFLRFLGRPFASSDSRVGDMDRSVSGVWELPLVIIFPLPGGSTDSNRLAVVMSVQVPRDGWGIVPEVANESSDPVGEVAP